MKTKTFFYTEDEIFWIGIGIPRELIDLGHSKALLIENQSNIPPNRLRDITEGNTAIVNLLTEGDDGLKYAALPAEEYVKILEESVLPAIHSALYMYDECDADKEKFIQRTRILCTFIVAYIEASLATGKIIGEKILRDEIFVIFEVLEANNIELLCEGDIFPTYQFCKEYVKTWHVEKYTE